jgi:hypothetical protein
MVGAPGVPVIVKVTLDPKSTLVAVTLLAPGVDPRVRSVFLLASAIFSCAGPGLTCGVKVSPGALLVHVTEPQFEASPPVMASQSIETTRAPGTVVLIGAL